MTLRPAFAVALLAALPGLAVAQVRPLPLPGRGPSPLLFARLSGPAGSQVTLYQGRAAPRTFDAPAVVGLRPGYLYRYQISQMRDHPGLSLYPTIQVVGTLHMPPKCNVANFPATVHLTDADVEAVVSGSLITKVIYLEHPDRAEPTATRPGEILETTLGPREDPTRVALERGRIMMIVHVGSIVPTPEELAAMNAPGTVLMPGDRSIAPAARPPLFPQLPSKFFDPRLGPRPPEEECIHDGGDRGVRAGFDNQGQLGGIDPEDAVAEYRDAAGRKRVICSNRVCVCVPRFGALRVECPLVAWDAVQAPARVSQSKRELTLNETVPPLQAAQAKAMKGFTGVKRPSENVNTQALNQVIGLKVLAAEQFNSGLVEALGTKVLDTLSRTDKALLLKQMKLALDLSSVKGLAGADQVYHTSIVARVKGLDVVTASVSTRDLTVCCAEAPIPPEGPLCLFKCADRACAKIGDVVTFTLRYSNTGGRPMTDVAITDSLSGRLEYVEGSAESDRDAVFTTQLNEAGSLVLRWEISGTLPPGQTGKVRFKARVR